MSIGQNIKRLRESHDMTQAQLGQIAGVTDKAVSTWEADIKIPRMGAVQKIADYFHLPKSAILDELPQQPNTTPLSRPLPPGFSPLPKMKKWPVLGATACGEPLHREVFDEEIFAPDDIKADIVFRCIGDSMINARIFDGDYVFIRRQPEVENGQIAVVRQGDEYTLKRFYHHPDYVELRAENPTFPAIVLRGEEAGPENFEVVGLAVAFLSPVQ